MTMRSLLYIGRDYPDGGMLRQDLQGLVQGRLEVCTSLRALALEIMAAWDDPIGALLVAVAGPDDFAALFALRELFKDPPLVLLLAEGQPDTLRLAHRLQPRLLSAPPHDFTTIKAVLAKMLVE